MQHLSNTTGAHSNFLRRYALKKDNSMGYPFYYNSGNIPDNKYHLLNLNNINQRHPLFTNLT